MRIDQISKKQWAVIKRHKSQLTKLLILKHLLKQEATLKNGNNAVDLKPKI